MSECDRIQAELIDLLSGNARWTFCFYRHDVLGGVYQAAAIGGIKFPTGDTAERPRLGSGSFDFLMGLAADYEGRRWLNFADVRYRMNTEGKDDRERGDVLFLDAAVGIRPWLTAYTQPDLVLMLEMNYELFGRTRQAGRRVRDSGGQQLSVAPAFWLTYRNWALKGGIQFPVFQRFQGNQPEADFRVVLAIETHF